MSDYMIPLPHNFYILPAYGGRIVIRHGCDIADPKFRQDHRRNFGILYQGDDRCENCGMEIPANIKMIMNLNKHRYPKRMRDFVEYT